MERDSSALTVSVSETAALGHGPDVAPAIARSERLRKYFQLVGMNSRDYFINTANGLFLWVVIVLRQLETAKSRKAFETRLKQFSEASSKMEHLDDLYESVLSRIDKGWSFVKETLRWLVFDELSVEELKAQLNGR